MSSNPKITVVTIVRNSIKFLNNLSTLAVKHLEATAKLRNIVPFFLNDTLDNALATIGLIEKIQV